MNPITPLELGELKTFLQSLKPDTILCPGFGNPHPYRATYSTCAFEPLITTTVRALLEDVNRAMTTRLLFSTGEESDYTFDDRTPVFIASPNHFGNPMTFESLLMTVETWVKIGEGFGRTH